MSTNDEILDLTIDLDLAIKKLANSLIREAISLVKKEIDTDEKIHELRKFLKKIRALLRLVRERIDQQTFDRENKRFRDLGRKVEGIREAKVRIDTLRSLSDNYNDSLSADAYKDLEHILIESHSLIMKDFYSKDWDDIRNTLTKGKRNIVNWLPEQDNFNTFRESMKKVYRRGYKALNSARRDPNSQVLHEMRKRVKYLRYQLTYLDAMWPKVFRALEDSLHDLSDYLGEEHDLHNFATWLNENKWPGLSSSNREILDCSIQKQQEELRCSCLKLGEKVFCEKPRRFIARMSCYW